MPALAKRPSQSQLVEEITQQNQNKEKEALKNMRYGAAIKDKKETVLENRNQQVVEKQQQLAQQVEQKLEAVESKKTSIKDPKPSFSQPKAKPSSGMITPKAVAPKPNPTAFGVPKPKPTNSSLLEKFLTNHPELRDRIAKILPHAWMQKALTAALTKQNELKAAAGELVPNHQNENNTAPTPFQTVPRKSR